MQEKYRQGDFMTQGSTLSIIEQFIGNGVVTHVEVTPTDLTLTVLKNDEETSMTIHEAGTEHANNTQPVSPSNNSDDLEAVARAVGLFPAEEKPRLRLAVDNSRPHLSTQILILAGCEHAEEELITLFNKPCMRYVDFHRRNNLLFLSRGSTKPKPKKTS